MQNLIRFIKKNYIYVNITFLLLTIYIILFPIISIPIKSVFPAFGECTYLRVTGKPCPLCGGTRYIQNLPKIFDNINYLWHPFGVIVLFVIFEGFFRCYNIITRKREKTDKYIEMDLTIHLFALICFNLYEIIFIITH